MQTITVSGNHGTISVDLVRGEPISFDDTPEDDALPYSAYGIKRFDLAEWSQFWGEQIEPGATIDICDLGYWYCDTDGEEKYEHACITESRDVRMHELMELYAASQCSID